MLLSSVHNVTYVSGFEVPVRGRGRETRMGRTPALCATRGARDGTKLAHRIQGERVESEGERRLDQNLVFPAPSTAPHRIHSAPSVLEQTSLAS